jgi:hypothetical protein
VASLISSLSWNLVPEGAFSDKEIRRNHRNSVLASVGRIWRLSQLFKTTLFDCTACMCNASCMRHSTCRVQEQWTFSQHLSSFFLDCLSQILQNFSIVLSSHCSLHFLGGWSINSAVPENCCHDFSCRRFDAKLFTWVPLHWFLFCLRIPSWIRVSSPNTLRDKGSPEMVPYKANYSSEQVSMRKDF